MTKTDTPWFTTLLNDFNSKIEKLGLESDQASDQADELRHLFIEKCREQYAAGNKAGVEWQRKQNS